MLANKLSPDICVSNFSPTMAYHQFFLTLPLSLYCDRNMCDRFVSFRSSAQLGPDFWTPDLFGYGLGVYPVTNNINKDIKTISGHPPHPANAVFVCDQRSATASSHLSSGRQCRNTISWHSSHACPSAPVKAERVLYTQVTNPENQEIVQE